VRRDRPFGKFLPVVADELFDALDHLVGFLSRGDEEPTLPSVAAPGKDLSAAPG